MMCVFDENFAVLMGTVWLCSLQEKLLPPFWKNKSEKNKTLISVRLSISDGASPGIMRKWCDSQNSEDQNSFPSHSELNLTI